MHIYSYARTHTCTHMHTHTHTHTHTNTHTHTHQLDLPDIDPTGPGCQKLLFKCAHTGVMATLKKLVEAGCNPRTVRNETNQTALHVACSGGHLHLVHYLLTFCDPNERDSMGRNCLDVALEADPRPQAVMVRIALAATTLFLYFSFLLTLVCLIWTVGCARGFWECGDGEKAGGGGMQSRGMYPRWPLPPGSGMHCTAI